MLVLILTLEIGHYSIHWSSWAAVKLELAGQDPVSILGGFLSFLGEVPASGTGCIDSVISLLPRGGPYFRAPSCNALDLYKDLFGKHTSPSGIMRTLKSLQVCDSCGGGDSGNQNLWWTSWLILHL
jgi:hypothetical protein